MQTAVPNISLIITQQEKLLRRCCEKIRNNLFPNFERDSALDLETIDIKRWSSGNSSAQSIHKILLYFIIKFLCLMQAEKVPTFRPSSLAYRSTLARKILLVEKKQIMISKTCFGSMPIGRQSRVVCVRMFDLNRKIPVDKFYCIFVFCNHSRKTKFVSAKRT